MQVKLFWVHSPMRDKGFSAKDRGGNAVDFEKQINEWLTQNPDIEVAHVEQSACGGSWGAALWLVSVWYTREDGA